MKACLVAIFLLLFTASGFAQLQLLPLGHPPAAAPAGKPQAPTGAAQDKLSQSISLPFWDDFSYLGGQPDPALWLDDSAATITYGHAILPPSWGVASFDGIRSNGTPYSETPNSQAAGKNDKLESVAINLSNVPAGERATVFLSFYWQLQGRANRPELRDAFRLYFLDDQGAWLPVWSRQGDNQTSAESFQQELISLQEAGNQLSANFFHEAFQFKFQSESRQDGAFDQWHLDYVFLDRGRSAANRYYKDKAVSTHFPSLFAPYTALPLEQFFENPAAYVRPTLPFSAFSFYPPGQTEVVNYDIKVRTESGTLVLSREGPVFGSLGEEFQGQSYHSEAPEGLPADALQAYRQAEKLVLNTHLQLESVEDRPEWYRNDAIRVQNVLHNYFAYDDGSAESAVSLTNAGDRLAYRFRLEKEAILSDVLIYSPYYYAPTSSNQFNLMIMRRLKDIDESVQDEVLYTQRMSVRQWGLNAFDTLELSHSIQLPPGDFYIGIQQIGNDRIPIGFDKNTSSMNQLYSSINSSSWMEGFSTEGSLMIRPQFREDAHDPTGLEEADFPPVSVYPNPTRDKLWVESQARQLRIYDLQGSLMLQEPAQLRSEISLGKLAPGLYLLQLEYPQGIQSKRILLIK